MTSTAQPVVRPGGAQTRVKLSICADYFQRFTQASQSARDRVYIDGFASSGKGIDPRTSTEYAGSALLCLEVDPPFTECYLVERDEGRAAHLRELTASYPHAHVRSGGRGRRAAAAGGAAAAGPLPHRPAAAATA